jgi:hypothetical protein
MIRRSLTEKAIDWDYDSEELERFAQEIWPTISAIPGALSRLESFFLFDIARKLGGSKREMDQPNARHVLEIRSYKGRSTTAIGLGLQSNPNGQKIKLVCVDPQFDPEKGDMAVRKAFEKNIEAAQISDLITICPGHSNTVVRTWPEENGLIMLWIDGNHEFEHVRDDLQNWLPFLVPGGVIAAHDWYLVGVQMAIERCVFGVPYFQHFRAINGNLISATRTDLPPTQLERGRKKRFYWTLKMGNPNVLIHCLGILRDLAERPFGSLSGFLRSKPKVR